MNARRLLQFFDQRRERQAPLALATVIATEGSTYSKAGARMLIDGHGIFQGMLSGGCLEGDLAIRAQQVIETAEAQLVSYDLGADDEELWGLGVGCDGVMKILLQPLTASCDYEPFVSIVEIFTSHTPAVVSTVVESAATEFPVGTTRILRDGDGDGGPAVFADENVTTVDTLTWPAPRLLILGGGLDAEPLVRFVEELGWYCTVADHRPATIANGDFGSARTVVYDDASTLPQQIDLAEFDAAIVMSHRLVSDRAYLRALAATAIGYIGLLGPVGRRDRLLQDLGDLAADLTGRLQGPAGIDIGGQGPAAIALSIAAALTQYLDEQRS